MRKLISLFVALAVVFTVFASAAVAGSGDGKVVGFIQTDNANPWRLAETESFKSEAKKRGYELKYTDAQSSQAKQIQAMRSLIAQGVDAIFLAPQVETGWEPVLKEAKRAGIPVILVDRNIETDDDSLYLANVRADQYSEGVMAGEYAVKISGGKAKIAELQGTIGSSAAILRQKGFMDAIKDHPGMEVILTQSGDFNESKGKEVMEAFLKAVGDEIDIVYSHNDGMSLGAILAIQEYGLKPNEDIKIISVDAIRDAFTAIDDGNLTCTIECTPVLAPLSFDTYEAAMAGKPVEKWTRVEAKLFDADNYKQFIDERQY